MPQALNFDDIAPSGIGARSSVADGIRPRYSVSYQNYDIDVAVVSRGFVCVSHSLTDLGVLFSDSDLEIDSASGNIVRFKRDESTVFGGAASGLNCLDEGSPMESPESPLQMTEVSEDSDPEEAALKRAIAQQELNDGERKRASVASATIASNREQSRREDRNTAGAKSRRSTIGATSDVAELYVYVPEYSLAFMGGMTKFLLGFTDAKDPNLRHIARAWTLDAMEQLPYLLDPLLEDLLGFLLLVSSTHGPAAKVSAWEGGHKTSAMSSSGPESHKAKVDAVLRKYFEGSMLAAMDGRESNFDVRAMLQDVLRTLEKLMSLFKSGDKMATRMKGFKPSEQLLSGLDIYYGSHFYKNMLQEQLHSKSQSAQSQVGFGL